MNSADIKDKIYDIVAQVKEHCRPDKVKVINDIALIATVGRHMSSRPGISGQLFAELGKNDINIRMIAHDADLLRHMIFINSDNAEIFFTGDTGDDLFI